MPRAAGQASCLGLCSRGAAAAVAPLPTALAAVRRDEAIAKTQVRFSNKTCLYSSASPASGGSRLQLAFTTRLEPLLNRLPRAGNGDYAIKNRR